MAQVLAYMMPDGENFLPTESRNRVVRSLVEVPITYSDESGEGSREFVIQNVTGESSVRNLTISNLQDPTDPDGNVLSEDFSWFDTNNGAWTVPSETAVIGSLEPGDFVRVIARMRAGAGALPRSYGGIIACDYDEVVLL